MKVFLRLLFVYIFFLIQTAIVRPQLDLVLLLIVVLSLHDTPIYAIVSGVWAGFLAGLVNPVNFGIHIVIFATIAFVLSVIRRFIFKDKIYFIAILILSMLFKYLISLIFIHSIQPFSGWLLQLVVILTLAIPLEIFFINVFYRQWKMHVSESTY